MGTVVYIGDGIARIHGLQKARQASFGFPNSVFGMVLNLKGQCRRRYSGRLHRLKRAYRQENGPITQVPVGGSLIGRVVTPGPARGRQGAIHETFRNIESPAPGVTRRRSVHQALQTGIKALILWFPSARPEGADHRRPGTGKTHWPSTP